ncbi:alpha/beta hydrolase [Dactylosporangium siamense]
MLPVLVSAAIVLTPDPAQAHEPTCQRRDTTVTLTPDSAVRYRIAGWMCRPARPTNTVQVLMSGFTYDHKYWSLTGSGRSYVSAALQAGTAIYTVDRVGVGVSDRPPADEVTVLAEAFVAHQLVQQLRRGPSGFQHVIGVGHSYGSAIWMIEAANHHDVDALILTGYLHQANPVQQAAVAAGLHQASEDPLFANSPPPGYVTTKPGARGRSFYYLPGADKAALALDEQTKATGTSGQRATMNLARDPSYSRNITVPVLLVVGDHDALSCDIAAGLLCSTAKQVCARERDYYPTNTPVYAAVVPKAGHSINGHRTAAAMQSSLVGAWARTAFSHHAVAWSRCQA